MSMSGFANQPRILNVTLTNQNTEYEAQLPEGTTRFAVQARAAVDVKLSFAKGESGSEYWTVKAAPARPLIVKDVLGKTGGDGRKLYLQSGTAGAVVEILCWI
jgi:hypothetical protein